MTKSIGLHHIKLLEIPSQNNWLIQSVHETLDSNKKICFAEKKFSFDLSFNYVRFWLKEKKPTDNLITNSKRCLEFIIY